MKKIRLLLTDIRLHSQKKELSTSFERKIHKYLENHTPSRFYSSTEGMDIEVSDAGAKIRMSSLPPNFQEAIKEYIQKGYEVEFVLPINGLPFSANKEMDKFLESKITKRIIRKLEKAGKV